MRPQRFLLMAFVTASLFSCNEERAESVACTSFQDEKSELIAMGSYPDYYYNLANELSNAGRTEQAIEAYKSCIAESQSQTFAEDAMYNLSMLYFESEQDSQAYAIMDRLIAKKYTWLVWYKNAEHAFVNTREYVDRLVKIDSISDLKNSPNNCVFHYEDVANFTTAFTKSQTDWANAPTYFYQDYFSRASSGLFFFQKFKIRSSSHAFAFRVEDKQRYFESILPNLQKLQSQELLLREYFNKFEDLYSKAVFPDVYFVVGCFNAGGTSSPFGLLIGTEMHAKTQASDFSNFNHWEKTVARGFSNLPLITLHELVHIQQNDNYSNLLGNAIFEGAADFISELVCGAHINVHVHEWADRHEDQVWAEFEREMYGESSSNWIGNADLAKDKPADLGYYVGYKICESYYNKQPDKEQAISDILSTTDWNSFYLKSGYMK